MSRLRIRAREARGEADSRLLIGIVIVAVGVALLLMRVFPALNEGGAVLVIGVAFLVAWSIRGAYALLVAGCVLSSIGVGGIIAGHVDFSHAQAISLGVGFCAIYILDLMRTHSSPWWPLVPGAILVVSGVFANSHVLREFFWPAALIVVGLLIVNGGLHERKIEKSQAADEEKPGV